MRAHADFSADIYTPVDLVGPVFTNDGAANDPSNRYYNFPACAVSDTITEEKWCVLQDYIGTNQPARAALMGLTWVKANVTDLAHTHVKVESGALVSAESGRARIITPPAATGIGFVLVLLGGGGGGEVPCLPDSFFTGNFRQTDYNLEFEKFNVATCESTWVTVLSGGPCTEAPVS